jgi:phosphohistidine phosphatase
VAETEYFVILTIWRHGEAADAPSDYERELTASGREDLHKGVLCLQDACSVRGLSDPTHVFYSPWVRTAATASIIGNVVREAQLESADALAPGVDLASVDTLLEGPCLSGAQDDHVLLVSHQPLVSRLIDHYLGGRGRVPPLSPAGFCTLLLSTPGAGCAELLFWALPPEYQVGI